MKKFLIALNTWREHFEKTIWMINENIKFFKSNEKVKISLLINYDTSFKNIADEKFKIDENNYIFENVDYFWIIQAIEYIDELKKIWLLESDINLINQNHWYWNKKNLLLLYAVKNNYDYILYYDDDEYPITCISEEWNDLKWIKTDLIGWHLKWIESWADITFWFWSWYISPIPTNIIEKIPFELSWNIWSALEIWTDVITKDKFSKIENIFCIPKKVPDIEEVKEIEWSKLISWGNLCFSVNSVLNWKVPCYYFPPDARWEDSIMSMRLSKTNVYSVPCWIFHDSFQNYLEITDWIYPNNFDFSLNNKEHYERFYSVFVWWLSYTPFLMKLKYKSDYEKFYNKMIDEIKKYEKQFLWLFSWLKNKLTNGSIVCELEKFKDNVSLDFDKMIKADKVWEKVLKKYNDVL